MSEEIDTFISKLSPGMKVQIYNASGTLRYDITIDRPTVLTMDVIAVEEEAEDE